MSEGLAAWRHPRPDGAAGRCLGRLDLPVDRRRAKRLAHRIRAQARREGRPGGIVMTSRAGRTRAVGAMLRGRGWCHRVDGRLDELDFGDWDGRGWGDIGASALQAWCDDFAAFSVGGAESVSALLARVAAWWRDQQAAPPDRRARCIVGHGGWISASRWLQVHADEPPRADAWPAAPSYGERAMLDAPRPLRPDADPAASAS